MKIFITTPDFSLHGGIRIIVEWANRLAEMHTVYLYSLKGGLCTWFALSSKVNLVADDSVLKDTDCIIITSPHSIHYEDLPYPKKKFVFMQMAEHLFRPHDNNWLRTCRKFYTTKYPLIAISEWNIKMLKTEFGRTGVTHYVGNGVNFVDFPISHKPKDGITVLVEGWESGNPSKDPLHVGPRAAELLKRMGAKIIAYSGLPLKTEINAPDEYYCKPSLGTMNELYERATILIKASRYDARSCAPMEAMTKGTPTVRAIINGDDDLIHEVNCHRVDYQVFSLFLAATVLLNSHEKRKKLSENCIRHVKQFSWDYWMPIINNILCND